MTVWFAVAAVAVLSAMIKAAGPALLPQRILSRATNAILDALAPALITGLVISDLTRSHWKGTSTDLLPGLCVVVMMRLRNIPDVVCVTAAVAVTVAIRMSTRA